MKREDGFYWVRNRNKWKVMLYYSNVSGGYWYAPAVGIELYDNDFDEINETRLLPPS